MYRHMVAVEFGPWYRTDTASGSSTPTSVLWPDGVTTVANAFGGSGSTVKSGTLMGNAVFYSTAATLYLKRLTYKGALSGDTPITSTGRDLTQPVGQDTGTILNALPGTYASITSQRMRRFGGNLVAVADNCHGYGDQPNAQTKVGTSRCPHTIGPACSDLRFVYTNWGSYSTTADVDGPATITVKASVEISGTIYRLTFNGQTTGTVDPGGILVTDPLGFDVPAGTVIYSRTYVSASSWYPTKFSGLNAGGGGFTTTTDLTAPGSAAVSDANHTAMYVPSAIVGTPSTDYPALLITGDSVAMGFHDPSFDVPGYSTTYTQLSGGGYLMRALGFGKYGVINIGTNGDSAAAFAASANHFRRASMARFCTHAVVEYGRNDITGGATLATVQSNAFAVCNLWVNRGLRVILTTITPKTSSTDYWCTTANQTASAGESVRVAYNTWVRAGAPVNPTTKAAVAVGTSGALLAGSAGHPIAAVWDPAAVCESSLNSGVWKPGRIVADASITSGASIVASATAAFVNANPSAGGDIGAPITIPGAGAAGGVLTAQILSVQSATQATIYGTASTTVSSVAAYIGAMTDDGTHLYSGMATIPAAACDTAKIT